MSNKHLFKKFISFSYGGWVSLLIGLGSSMLTTRILSPDILGRASMYTLATNVLMVIVVLGTDQAFVRFFYEEDEYKRPQLLSSCLRIPLYLFIGTTAIIILNSKLVSKFLFDEPNPIYSFLLIIGLLSNIIFKFGILVIRMQQKGKLYSNIQIISKLLSISLIAIIYFIIGEKIEVSILSVLFTTIIISMISVCIEKVFWKDCIKSILQKNYSIKSSTKNIIQFSYPLMFTTLVFWLFQSFDKIALREWSSFHELGLYTASFRIIAMINVIQTTFTAFWSPICYEHYQKHPEDTNFYKKMNSLVSLIMLGIGIATIAGKDIIVLLLGNQYRTTANIMPFLVFIPVMYTISETTVIGINFKKKTKWHVIIAAISCALNVIGNMILVPRYGALGASISTAASYIVFFTVRTFVSRKFYKINFNLYKIYFFILLISVYAAYAIINNIILNNIIFGMLLLSLLMLFYKYEVEQGFTMISKKVRALIDKK